MKPSSVAPTAEDLPRFRAVQRLAYDCATSVAAELRPRGPVLRIGLQDRSLLLLRLRPVAGSSPGKAAHLLRHVFRGGGGALPLPRAQRVPLEQLALSPQCGFASGEASTNTPPAAQEAKLRLVVQVAQRVWPR